MSLNCLQMPQTAVKPALLKVCSFRHRSFKSAIEGISCPATPLFKPGSCTSSTDGKRKADAISAGTEGPWLGLVMHCGHGHVEQDFLGTCQAQLFTA